MKLNIGCGNHYAQGWVNVDLARTDDVRPDIVGDITVGLDDIDDGSAERIYLGHVLEHLEPDMVGAALAECKRLISRRGVMMIVGPDCDSADRMLEAGSIDAVEHGLVVTGAGRWAGDVHRWRSTGAETADWARGCGWHVRDELIEDVDGDVWPVTSRIGWQFALVALPVRTS